MENVALARYEDDFVHFFNSIMNRDDFSIITVHCVYLYIGPNSITWPNLLIPVLEFMKPLRVNNLRPNRSSFMAKIPH